MVYLIAQVGANHRGSLDSALEHLHAAKDAGANAARFQTSYTQHLEPKHSAALKPAHMVKLHSQAQALQIDFLSTPFDFATVDFLDSLPVPAFKVASGDLTNLPLLAHIARTGRPIYISTGMSNIGEVADAVGVCRRHGNQDITLLHCVSLLPTPHDRANLRAICTLERTFELPVGYTDHTIGNEACFGAVALGATIIEKHFALKRYRDSPDREVAANLRGLIALRRGIDIISQALGDGRKVPQAGEIEVAEIARRSVFSAHALKKGELLTPDLLTCHCPGTGIPASQFGEIIGHRLKLDLPADEMLQWDMLEGV